MDKMTREAKLQNCYHGILIATRFSSCRCTVITYIVIAPLRRFCCRTVMPSMLTITYVILKHCVSNALRKYSWWVHFNTAVRTSYTLYFDIIFDGLCNNIF